MAELRLDGFAQVLQDMKAVGDLLRLRRAFVGPLGEKTVAIGLMISTPGCRLSQSTVMPVARSGNKSSTSRRSKSTMMDHRRPRRAPSPPSRAPLLVV